jgi:hypothetical protein
MPAATFHVHQQLNAIDASQQLNAIDATQVFHGYFHESFC